MSVDNDSCKQALATCDKTPVCKYDHISRSHTDHSAPPEGRVIPTPVENPWRKHPNHMAKLTSPILAMSPRGRIH